MELLKEARPNVKESTLKQYLFHLEKLKKSLPKEYEKDGWDFLRDVEKIKNAVSQNVYTSQRNTFNSVVILLMALNHDNRYDDVIKTYTDMRDELNQKYVKEKSEGKMSEKQEANFVTSEEIMKMLSEMDKIIKTEKIKSKTDITNSDRELLTTFTLFHLLLRCPTRNDMAGMILTTPNEFKKIHDDIRKNTNYLIKRKDGFQIELNEYKTDKTYGRVIIPVPKEVVKVLRMFIRSTNKRTGDVLFTSSINKPLSRNGISQLLLKTSKKYMGKSVSTTLMRKCVASDKFSEKNKEQEELAKICCHDVNTQNLVYVKK
jgi:integrase